MSETVTEQAALDELSRAIASALQDQGLRQRLRNDLRDSRYTTEHKLPLSDYLKGMSGGILLAKMSKETGKSREELLSLLRSVRPLEIYMPVKEHRESWRGGSNLQVASQLEENTLLSGYSLAGDRVALSAEIAPDVPTLSIVPVETDFSSPLGSGAVNRNDQGGESIGTYLITDPCLEPLGGEVNVACGGGGSVTKPGGLYLTATSLKHLGEGWLKGQPEIEGHIHGGDKTYGADLACVGEEQKEQYRYYNQNDLTWSGEALLFTQTQLDEYYAKYGQGFNVMMWEDDDGPCTIKTDEDITGALKLIAGAAGATAILIANPADADAWFKAAGTFVAGVYASASWLKSNDEFLGDAPQVNPGEARNGLWLDHDSKNGWIETRLLYLK